MSTDPNTYRHSHAAPGYGQRYDANYASGYYAAIYRDVETPLLEALFTDLAKTRKSLLDFACGTARITKIAAGHFDHVVGVDVSEAMLENARPLVPSATFICQDITEQPMVEKFDVVTAFRFFLNAEDELRREVLLAIGDQLNENGRLICNVHMNKYSILGVTYRLLEAVTRKPKHKTLSYDEFRKLLGQTGFEVEFVTWYGVMPRPGRLFSRFLNTTIGPIEKFFNKVGLNGRFAHTFLVVARPKQ